MSYPMQQNIMAGGCYRPPVQQPNCFPAPPLPYCPPQQLQQPCFPPQRSNCPPPMPQPCFTPNGGNNNSNVFSPVINVAQPSHCPPPQPVVINLPPQQCPPSPFQPYCGPMMRPPMLPWFQQQQQQPFNGAQPFGFDFQQQQQQKIGGFGSDFTQQGNNFNVPPAQPAMMLPPKKNNSWMFLGFGALALLLINPKKPVEEKKKDEKGGEEVNKKAGE